MAWVKYMMGRFDGTFLGDGDRHAAALQRLRCIVRNLAGDVATVGCS
jgi:hypothetical protein